MAKPHQRVFALVMALLFLATSVAFSLAIVWQIRNDKNQDSALETEQQQVSEIPKEEGKLQGTKLEGFTPVTSVEKLEIKDIKVGEGEVVKAGAKVKAHYTGALASDGTIFQSSHDQPGDQPVEFGLDQVIKGWTEGVPGMKVGGVRQLLIPAELAYGSSPPQGSGIPPNAPLVFVIELEGVTQ